MKNRLLARWVLLAAGIGGLAGCVSGEGVTKNPPAVHEVSPPRSGADWVNAGSEDISGVLAPVILRAHIPGAVAVVLRGDRIVAHGVAGVRKAGAIEPVTLDDQFELCSGTKAMTATLVGRLVEQGRLSWETTFADVFGDALPEMDPAWREVTVEQALAHRAGTRDEPLTFARAVLWSDATVAEQRRAYAAKILSRPPRLEPKKTFLYNSTDYLLVGALLEKITGRTWEDLVREQLFQPLGLASAGFGPPGTAGRIDQPWGHGRRWLWYVPLPGTGPVAWDPGDRAADYPAAGAPAGMIHMSVPDWAKFVSAHLRGDAANPHRQVVLLKPAAFDRLHEAGGETYSGGWFVETKPWAKGSRAGDTGRILFHPGDNDRWNTVVYLAPEIDFAVLVACNRGRMWQPVDEIAGTLVGKFAAQAKQLSGESAR